MSTSAMIRVEKNEVSGKPHSFTFYQHWDGYPEPGGMVDQFESLYASWLRDWFNREIGKRDAEVKGGLPERFIVATAEDTELMAETVDNPFKEFGVEYAYVLNTDLGVEILEGSPGSDLDAVKHRDFDHITEFIMFYSPQSEPRYRLESYTSGPGMRGGLVYLSATEVSDLIDKLEQYRAEYEKKVSPNNPNLEKLNSTIEHWRDARDMLPEHADYLLDDDEPSGP